MDSISFVLGVRTAQLRGNLKELLYHNSEGESAEDRWAVGGGCCAGWALAAGGAGGSGVLAAWVVGNSRGWAGAAKHCKQPPPVALHPLPHSTAATNRSLPRAACPATRDLAAGRARAL